MARCQVNVPFCSKVHLRQGHPAWAWLCNLRTANHDSVTPCTPTSLLFPAFPHYQYILSLNLQRFIRHLFYCTCNAFGRGILNTIKGMHKAGGKKICKSASSYNPAMITRGTKEWWSHVAAPLKTAMSWGTFQIIPVSQNNTMTHKYHPTSEWTKVNIRYKALNIASPTHFLFILHTDSKLYIFLYFLLNLILARAEEQPHVLFLLTGSRKRFKIGKLNATLVSEVTHVAELYSIWIRIISQWCARFISLIMAEVTHPPSNGPLLHNSIRTVFTCHI